MIGVCCFNHHHHSSLQTGPGGRIFYIGVLCEYKLIFFWKNIWPWFIQYWIFWGCLSTLSATLGIAPHSHLAPSLLISQHLFNLDNTFKGKNQRNIHFFCLPLHMLCFIRFLSDCTWCINYSEAFNFHSSIVCILFWPPMYCH